MTAVELTIPGAALRDLRQRLLDGRQIKHVYGQPEVPLEQFLLPMLLASDAVVTNGDLIGDPTQGALVGLAEKGGLDPCRHARSPRAWPTCPSPRTTS